MSRTIRVKWDLEQGVGLLDGKVSGPRASDLVDAVDQILRRNPDTIVMGDTYSIGPYSTAVSYTEPPYALLDRQGTPKAKGYSALELWSRHWNLVLEWGKSSRKGSLRNDLIRLASEKPELRKHLVPLLRKAEYRD